jgi:hypothetical protein
MAEPACMTIALSLAQKLPEVVPESAPQSGPGGATWGMLPTGRNSGSGGTESRKRMALNGHSPPLSVPSAGCPDPPVSRPFTPSYRHFRVGCSAIAAVRSGCRPHQHAGRARPAEGAGSLRHTSLADAESPETAAESGDFGVFMTPARRARGPDTPAAGAAGRRAGVTAGASRRRRRRRRGCGGRQAGRRGARAPSAARGRGGRRRRRAGAPGGGRARPCSPRAPRGPAPRRGGGRRRGRGRPARRRARADGARVARARRMARSTVARMVGVRGPRVARA